MTDRLSERTRLQFRLKAFNALNHSPRFGQSTSMLNMMLGTGSPAADYRRFCKPGDRESLQAGVKWQF